MQSSKDAMKEEGIDPGSFSSRLENMLVDKNLIDDHGSICDTDEAIGFVHDLVDEEFGEGHSELLVFHPPHIIDMEDYDRMCLIVDRVPRATAHNRSMNSSGVAGAEGLNRTSPIPVLSSGCYCTTMI